MLHTLSEGLRLALQADEATVLLLDEPTSDLVVSASVGLEREVTEAVRIKLGEGFAGKVALARAPVVVPDVAKIETASPFLNEALTWSSIVGFAIILVGTGFVTGMFRLRKAKPA